MKFEGLRNGAVVLLREPNLDDVDTSALFFRSLSADDRRYLRVDVTKREIVERRIRQAIAGEVHRIVALVDDAIVGDGALEFSTDSWRRDTAEIRVIVDGRYRRLRLGTLLIRDLFSTAQQREIEKVVVKMAAAQTAAQRVFERLGFRVEGILSNYIKDIEGRPQDLVVMSCTMDQVWKEMKDFYKDADWPDG